MDERLQANRNLCEDFVSIDEVDTQPFILCGEIDLRSDADINEVYAQVLYQVQQYLAPVVKNYTLEEMLAKQDASGNAYSVDDIFDGPLLDCGFIDAHELAQAELRTDIRLSDIINIIVDITGVVAVRDLIINPVGTEQALANKWLQSVALGKKPVLDNEKIRLIFYKRGMPISASKTAAIAQAQLLVDAQLSKLETPVEYDFDIPIGRYRAGGAYHSLQHHLPEVYGLSDVGLPPNATAQRKAQALQLKGYLLFFEQLLANYLAQLSHVRDIFSSDASKSRTNFYQAVTDFADWQKVYAHADPEQAMLATIDDSARGVNRKNLFLDNLIARFAEEFSEFANVMYGAFGASPMALVHYKCDFINAYPSISAARGLGYNQSLTQLTDIWNSNNISGLEQRLCKLLGIANATRRNLSDVAYDIYAELDATPDDEFRFRIRDKVSGHILLSSSTKYVTQADAQAEMRRAIMFGKLHASYQIKQASNGKYYFNIVDDTEEVIARRIEYFTSQSELEAAIAEVVAYLNSAYSDEGMYLIENMLLRPQQEDDPFLPVCVDVNCEECADHDPYSYRIHIILPAFGSRFNNMDFRRYAESLIRSEVPAHILPKICWVNKDDMATLEKLYQDWLKLKHGRTSAQRTKKLTDFIRALYAAKNVYAGSDYTIVTPTKKK